jgi:hypothetical protein
MEPNRSENVALLGKPARAALAIFFWLGLFGTLLLRLGCH